ncbi:MAG: hypothetical protein H6P98_2496, partial [Candidatus Aminicenantes bacterium]|nr:hypothetical protein [Candidatus Aminicenantes bacterium]
LPISKDVRFIGSLERATPRRNIRQRLAVRRVLRPGICTFESFDRLFGRRKDFAALPVHFSDIDIKLRLPLSVVEGAAPRESQGDDLVDATLDELGNTLSLPAGDPNA